MGVAQRMIAGVCKVGLPEVVFGDSLITRQDPHLVHSGRATLGLDAVVGPVLVTYRMKPLQFPIYPGAGLVAVNDRSVSESLFDLLFGAAQSFVIGLVGGQQGALADRLPEKVCKQFPDPVVGKKLVLIEIDGSGLDFWPVLHRLVYFVGEGGLVAGTADLAGLHFCPVFSDQKLHRRDIKDLASFVALHGLIGEGDAAFTTAIHRVYLHLVGAVHHLQGMTGMSLLSAAFLAALFPLALGPFETIAGRRFAGVPAVLVKLVF